MKEHLIVHSKQMTIYCSYDVVNRRKESVKESLNNVP